MKIRYIFNEIANESSTIKKMEILAKYKDNELLKRVLYLANSKRVKFYIKQIPEYTNNGFNGSLDAALVDLEKLMKREFTGNEAISYLKTILTHLNYDDAYIIERIIEKDCKIGMGTTFMNKVFTKLIEDTPYMGAKSYDVKLVKKLFEGGKRVFGQIKMDGRYCNAIIRGGEVELESRQGEASILTGARFVDQLKRFGDCVLNGELTIPGISRYESNGVIASLISIGNKLLKNEDPTKDIKKLYDKHGYYYQQALDAIKFTVWDTITIDEYFDAKSNVPYSQRLNNLGDLILKSYGTSDDTLMISIVNGRVLESFEDALAYFQEALNNGEEGLILKAFDGAWKDGKPNWQIKMKLEMDIDLIIVGFNYGTGKNENFVSSVTVTSSDGLVNTRPTGIDEKMMAFITENQEKLMNTILEVKCSGLTHDSKGNYALLHPVFKKLRDDKNTCDSLESIKQIEAMAKGLI
jgi:DNA ligase-1